MKRTLLYAVGVYALVICFGVYLKAAHGAEMTCRQLLQVCEKSCTNREGMYKFHCLGDSYYSDNPKYQCLCGDQYQSELTYQRTVTELRKLQTSMNSSDSKKK